MLKQYLKKNLGTIVFYLVVLLFVLYGFISVQRARSNAIAKIDYVATGLNESIDILLDKSKKKNKKNSIVHVVKF